MSAIKCSTCGGVTDHRGAKIHCSSCYEKTKSESKSITGEDFPKLPDFGKAVFRPFAAPAEPLRKSRSTLAIRAVVIVGPAPTF